ncbi:hypothetical protein NKR23_g11594 [Pleurostoma richardsiae]|uniref:Isochorismatase-like domain-containing protein n=1 Tax=Pleurostoma richardsiae TaxID=41990 RepID=A0AA38R9X1_9PEZI|nr:hypothetical protein NKR23_g11594 [Pleurostoma richardsiae]
MSPGSALFVIDIQNDLARDPNTQIPHAARVVAAGEQIVSAARAAIKSQHLWTEDSLSSILFVQHEEKPEEGPLVRGTAPWELVFQPQAGADNEMLVHKTTRSTFESNPGLEAQLKDHGVTHIIAFGIQSDCCVLETCKAALDLGFRVTVLHGAHSTYNSGGRTAVEIEKDVEEELAGKGAIVVSWQDTVRAWEQRR